MQTKKGSEVTVRSKEGVEYRRNSAGELPETTEAVSQETSHTLPLEESIATSRPRRSQNAGEVKDYVLYELNCVDTLDLC